LSDRAAGVHRILELCAAELVLLSSKEAREADPDLHIALHKQERRVLERFGFSQAMYNNLLHGGVQGDPLDEALGPGGKLYRLPEMTHLSTTRGKMDGFLQERKDLLDRLSALGGHGERGAATDADAVAAYEVRRAELKGKLDALHGDMRALLLGAQRDVLKGRKKRDLSRMERNQQKSRAHIISVRHCHRVSTSLRTIHHPDHDAHLPRSGCLSRRAPPVCSFSTPLAMGRRSAASSTNNGANELSMKSLKVFMQPF